MENNHRRLVSKVVIAGGGTAGWLAAAALSRQLSQALDVVLVESDEIGIVGVGEATIPPMRVFHSLLRIDEKEFMKATEATFKLGIEFDGWGREGESYIHSFGKTGKETWMADFVHFWLRAKELGIAEEFGRYCLEWKAAKEERFGLLQDVNVNYAYHLDAHLYGQFLRSLSEKSGVRRIEGKIDKINQNPETGFVESLLLADGTQVDGDLFLDCTGFRGLLIEQALHTGYEDWTHWLPCDRAVAIQTSGEEAPIPYTRSVAHDSGWAWRIPLQHRVGNGNVFCSRYMSDEEATTLLQSRISGEQLTDPKIIKFRTGKRRHNWNKNVIALGLASGFLEPLESTSIHLIMMGLTRLLHLFPFDGIEPRLVAEFNKQSALELESIRDFIILHYHVTQRQDSPFWRYCKNMDIPESLKHRIELFKVSAQAMQKDGELFRVDSWTQVMLGQGLLLNNFHNFARLMPEQDLQKFLDQYSGLIDQQMSKLPGHADFIKEYCAKL